MKDEIGEIKKAVYLLKKVIEKSQRVQTARFNYIKDLIRKKIDHSHITHRKMEEAKSEERHYSWQLRNMVSRWKAKNETQNR